MEEPEAILAEVRRWGRARNALRALLGGLVAGFGAILVARALGVSLPWEEMGFVILALASAGAFWPLHVERLYLWAGRRLGVGERLAAVEVLARNRVQALLEPLMGELSSLPFRPWRLLLGPVEAAGVGLALALGALVALLPVKAGFPVEEPAPLAVDTPALPEESPLAGQAPAPGLPVPPVVPTLPSGAGALGYTPYQDLLAAVLGLEEADLDASGEDLAARLAREEGLLRRLAEMLRSLASGGLTPSQRAELLSLAQAVGRADVRARISRLVERGDEAGAREAAQAVTAVLEAVTRTTEGPGGERDAGGSGETRGTQSAESTPGAPERPRDAASRGDGTPGEGEGFEEGVEGWDVAGIEPGEPPVPGEGEGWEGQDGGTSLAVRPILGEGPTRAYLVPGIPGETTASPPASPATLSSQELEVILRARGIPPELRDLVRRYFELIAGGGP